ncbi:MAG: agmatinase [Candidatus Blackburnbacteria bacterium]|nr:agmatinase [Candidatus Blackburnbacteria bacterium]
MNNIVYEKSEPFNFCGLDNQTFAEAKVVVFPVPYSSTTYWNPNTKDGPRALIEASRHLELFDQELQKDTSQVGIFTLDPISLSKNAPKEALEQIKDVVEQILTVGKFPLVLGGEHSISYGTVAAATEKYQNLSVLQLDAHSDSRSAFEGTKYHHGTVVRRIIEDLKLPVTQVGVRSISQEEWEYIEKSCEKDIFFAPELPIKEIVSTLNDNVYLSFDLDFLDPSIMPATGTPEPGGFSFYQALELLKTVARENNIVGADILELSPLPGVSAPDFLAAKLAYKIIGYATGR